MMKNMSPESAAIERFDFKKALKDNSVFPALAFLCMIVFYPVSAILNTFLSDTESIFSLCAGMSDFDNFVQIGLVICGLITAASSLNYLNISKKLNVYLSVGISRRQMYKNRVKAALVKFFVISFVPMAADFIICLFIYGFHADMLKACIYIAAGGFMLLLTGFAFGALGAAAAGNLGESVTVGVLGLLSPVMIIACVQVLITNFLDGSAYTFASYSNYFPYMFYGKSVNLVSQLSFLNPFLFVDKISSQTASYAGKNMTRFCIQRADANGNPTGYEQIGIYDILPLIIWCVISVAFIFAAMKIIERKKAENAGSFGANKAVNILFGSVFGFGVFSLFSYIKNVPVYVSLLLGVLGFAAVFLLFGLIMTRTAKTLKSMVKFVIPGLAVSLGAAAVMLTGGFGFSSRVPEVSEIQRAYITVPTGDTVVSMSNGGINIDGVKFSYCDESSCVGPFTTEGDLKTVTAVHAALAENSDSGEGVICISYYLKDGGIVNRCYKNVSNEILSQMTAVEDTDYMEQFIEDVFSSDGSYSWTELDKKYSSGEISDYEYFQISELMDNASLSSKNAFLCDNSKTIVTYLTDVLTDEEFSELYECLSKDLISQTAEKRLYPSEQPLGLISFSDSWYSEYDGDDITAISGESMWYSADIAIYGYMTDTVNFLKNHNLMGCFENTAAVKEAYVEKYIDIYNSVDFHYGSTSFFDAMFSVTSDLSDVSRYDYDYAEFFKGTAVTDNEKISALYNASYPVYYTDFTGYAVKFVFDNGTISYMYIPSDEAPSFIG
ncbi:MAG: hypothetical protein LUH40_04475 [Clostridiales bacterium]|nr:hypothetical protein [Clostridiales bacterium]